jgi:Nickel responsive protein SCO4226-like
MVRNSTGSQVRQVVLVERYFSAVTPHRLAELAFQTRAVAAREAAHGVRVAYVGSAAVPDEETCFCLFVADSMSAVERVNRHLLVPSVRIAEALVVAPLHE